MAMRGVCRARFPVLRAARGGGRAVGVRRVTTRVGWALLLLVVAPLLASNGCSLLERGRTNWWEARRDSTRQAPDPVTTREAVIQVYAARTVGWRGAFGVHSWIVVKPEGASHYTRYEVVGWGVARGAPAVRVDRSAPDNFWYGSFPQKLAEKRGPGVEAMIERVEAAVRTYPYVTTYRTWPGPNSNTFVAHVARAVPELRLDLPPTAIGKDFLPGGALIAPSPSGTGLQLSVLGALGVLIGLEEGVELNLLGLTLGIDFNAPALKLPGVGRVGFPQ